MPRFDENEFVLVAPGKYRMKIAEAYSTIAKSGKDAMKVKFVIADPGEFEGTTIEKVLPAWMVCKLASALGIEKKEEGGKSYYDVDGCDLEGRHVMANLTHREYQGKSYNEIGQDFEPDPEADIPF